jgi:hypothetical protein
LLVSGVLLRISAGVAALMLLSFAAAKIIAIVTGLDITICNCFGVARPLLSTQSLVIDFVMLLLAAQIIVFRNEMFSLPDKEQWRGLLKRIRNRNVSSSDN